MTMSKLFDDPFGVSDDASVTTEPDYAQWYLCFPGAAEGWMEGLRVEFFPQEGVPWYGMFSRGDLPRMQ
jgi:hypothetical protein